MSEAFTEKRAIALWKNYLWVESRAPAREETLKPSVVLPNADFFPDKFRFDLKSAEVVLRRVKRLMEVQHWNCQIRIDRSEDLEIQQKLLNDGVLGESSHGLGETRDEDPPENEITIFLEETLIGNPISLVASIAHNLSRYLVAQIEDEPAGGWTDSNFSEMADLVAVNEGFGVFLCNSAFTFDQWTDVHNQGWQYTKRGFLNDSEAAFILAIFCIRQKLDTNDAASALKPNPREIFLDSLGFVDELNSR